MTVLHGERSQVADAGETPAPAPLPLTITAAWAWGAFAQAIAFYAFGVLLFRYLTDVAAIGAATVGALIAASKIYDAVIDPLIGVGSDRVDTRMGRRRPLILAGGIIMGASLAVLFNVPADTTTTWKLAWVILGLIMFSTGYSIFAIPWMSMPAEMTRSSYERTRLMAWRVGFSSSGQAAGAIGGPVLLGVLGTGAAAYGNMGLLLGCLCVAATLVTVRYTRNAPSLLHEAAVQPLFTTRLFSIFRNRAFVVLSMIMATLYFGGALQAGAFALYTSRVLGIADTWLGTYFLVLTAAMLLVQPLWLAASRRWGKLRCLGGALAASMMAHCSLFVLPADTSMPLFLLVGAMQGAAGGGVFMLTQALLPDVMEDDFRRTGLRRSGLFAGAISLIDTAALALGAFALGLLLSHMGYVEGLGAGGEQPATAKLGVRLATSLIPAATTLICIALLLGFRGSSLAEKGARD